MGLRVFLLAHYLLFVTFQISASSLVVETIPGSTIHLDDILFSTLDEYESTFVLSPDLFNGDGNTLQLKITSEGYKPLFVTLSQRMIKNSPLTLTLTPRPFISRWYNHIVYSSLFLVFGVAGFLFLNKIYKRGKNNKKHLPHPGTNHNVQNQDEDLNVSTDLERESFDSYELINLIATGGISRVYKAKNSSGKILALKVMSNFLNDQDMVGKFIGEGHALKNIKVRLPKAPVVEVYDYGRENGAEDGIPYIAMELIEGEPLSELIKHDQFNYDEKIQIIKQLIVALHATHTSGVLHRDISPDNILVRDGNKIRICLIDFGVAKHESYWLKGTSYGAAYGKPEYMSPEQFSGDRNIDYRSDYYSLGVLIYALFCGKPPFQDSNTYKVGDMHKNDPIPRMPDSVPVNIQILITKLMAKKPSGRPKSPSEILSFFNNN